MRKETLTHERLLQVLSYDMNTGVFTRRIDAHPRRRFKAGEVAGSFDRDSGYVLVGIDGKRYFAHRLAWFFVHKAWPSNDIDHKDQVRHHNWIDNLRCVTRSENLQNQKNPSKRNKSGIRGIYWCSTREKWKVDISVGNKKKFIGRFSTIDEAKSARLSAVQKFHSGYLP